MTALHHGDCYRYDSTPHNRYGRTTNWIDQDRRTRPTDAILLTTLNQQSAVTESWNRKSMCGGSSVSQKMHLALFCLCSSFFGLVFMLTSYTFYCLFNNGKNSCYDVREFCVLLFGFHVSVDSSYAWSFHAGDAMLCYGLSFFDGICELSYTGDICSMWECFGLIYWIFIGW